VMVWAKRGGCVVFFIAVVTGGVVGLIGDMICVLVLCVCVVQF